MLCHPEKLVPQGWVGVTTPKAQTYQPSAGPQIPAVHEYAEPHLDTWVDGHVTLPEAEKDFKLRPLFLINLPHCKVTGSPSWSALSIPSPPAQHITNKDGRSGQYKPTLS